MYTVGLGSTGWSFGGDPVIAVPTGIKIFSWIATMWGKQSFDTLCRAVGFIFLFTVAVRLYVGSASSDRAYHDTYFVVAHSTTFFPWVLSSILLVLLLD